MKSGRTGNEKTSKTFLHLGAWCWSVYRRCKWNPVLQEKLHNRKRIAVKKVQPARVVWRRLAQCVCLHYVHVLVVCTFVTPRSFDAIRPGATRQKAQAWACVFVGTLWSDATGFVCAGVCAMFAVSAFLRAFRAEHSIAIIYRNNTPENDMSKMWRVSAHWKQKEEI